MTEPRDEVGSWLDEPVEPLAPPPGTYTRIKRHAARRRRHQAIAAAATAATVIVGLVAAPRLAGTFLRTGRSALTESAGPVAQPSVSHQPGNKLTSEPTIMGSGQPLPNGFAPISATFIGLKTGWALGTLATSCAADSGGTCLALARTDNAGTTWYQAQAPPTRTANAAGGVSQVRFLNRQDGWVFGPDLWWTRDGGSNWDRAGTAGQRVISLEAAGNRAFAVFATCAGAPPSAAPGGLTSGCSSYQLYSTVAGTADWRRVPGATTGPGAASVVLTQDTGYLLASGGAAVTVASGPVATDGAWQGVSTPCPGGQAPPTEPAAPASPSSPPAPSSPAASASPAAPAAPATRDALLAAASGSLFAVCSAGSPTAANQAKEILTSGDGGQSWQRRAVLPIEGTAWSAAVNPGGSAFLIATSTGLYISRDGGSNWQTALTGPQGGFGYVGMTDVRQGFAIPAARWRDGMVFTTDGGRSWFPVAGSP